MPKPKEFAKDAATAFFNVLDTDRDVRDMHLCALEAVVSVEYGVRASVDLHHATRCPVFRAGPCA